MLKFFYQNDLVKTIFIFCFALIKTVGHQCIAGNYTITPSNSIAGHPTQYGQVFTLEESISRALNYNRQLLGAVDNMTRAQYGIDLANSEFSISITPNGQAGFIGGDRSRPGWTAGGGVDFSKKFPTGTLISLAPGILKTRDHYLTDIQATVTQPLLRGLGKEYQLANLRGAQYVLRTAYRDLYIAQVELIFRTIQSLYEIAKLERSMELNLESFQRISQFRKAAQLKEKIGLADALDVYRAEIELNHAKDALKTTQERLDEAKDHFRDLLALPLDANVEVWVPIFYTPHRIDLDKAVEIALTQRIEVAQSQDDSRENERLSKLAKKNLLPELNLVLNYSNAGRGCEFSRSWGRRRENVFGIGVTTSKDINPVSDQILYAQSLLAISSGLRGLDETEAMLILEVKKAVRQLDRAFEQIYLQEEQIKTAQGELKLAKVKFDRGMADNFNVIQAEKSLRTAQLNYWSAIIDHILGEYRLLAAMGLLIDKPLCG